MRSRLTIWVAAVLLASALVTFVVVYRDTGQQIRGQIERDLRSSTSQLSQSLRLLGGASATRIAQSARRYVTAQPYQATSTLLFVIVPGVATVSNHPEVFAVRPGTDPGESNVQQVAENRQAARLLVPRTGYSSLRLPDVGSMRLLERSISVGGIRVFVGAGAPLELVERAQHGVAQAFILAGALALAFALLASYLVGARVSAPLRRMAKVAARVDAGDLGPRMAVPRGRRDEVRVLAEAFNHMLDRLAGAFARQREFVADASHELRTPLTVIRGQLEVLAEQIDPPGSEVRRVEQLVAAELGRIGRLVDDMLLLAGSDQAGFVRPEHVELRPFVQAVWDGVLATADRRFELGELPAGWLDADPDRLTQALRNLIGNAIEHTRETVGTVRLDVKRLASDQLLFVVTDDGPGVPATERELIFERFHRTDSARSRSEGGAGLGLAIVRAIAQAHGGSVRVADSGDGEGARFELRMPGFKAGRADRAELSSTSGTKTA